jgi:ornithine cyclodeaminase
MLLFCQKTGQLLAVLLDEGHLTDIRTVIASMITLKYLAPKKIHTIGIIGTGIQAKLQLEYLQIVTTCTNILVWGRNPDNTAAFKNHFKDSNYNIRVVNSIEELAENSNVIITTTPSTAPLLKANQIKLGTHITAIGSDTPEKIELDSSIIQKADILVSDSISQSKTRGEIFKARQNNCLDETKLVELGNLIKNPTLGRMNNHQITIADLTGVAVQDIMIATAIYNSSKNKENEH